MATMGIRGVSLVVALMMGFALAGGSYAGTAYACSCAASPLKKEIERSDAVFAGKVRSIDEGPTSGSVGTATGKITFTVQSSWKGPTAETVDVYGQGDGVNCYNTFEEGEAYIVYASLAEGAGDSAPLENNACGATKPLASADADLRLLASPTGSLPETGGVPLPGSVAKSATLTYVAPTFINVALAAGVLLVGRAVRGWGR